MLVQSLWFRVQGYVIIRANGRRLEAWLNAAVRDGVALWRVERATASLLVARAAAADFRRLARHGRRYGVRVDVLQKVGLPFWLHRMRRRPLFLLGGALFAAALYGLTQYVWFVDVEGAEAVPSGDVLRAAAEAGLRPGVRRRDVARHDVEQALYQQLPQLAWAAVDLQGVAATIRVVERTVPDDVIHGAGHLVAVRDGVVERVAVVTGEPLVAPGDTVQAGATLISGVLQPGTPAYEERVRAGLSPVVRAQGAVWGRTWYRGYGEVRAPKAAESSTLLPKEALVRQAVEAARAQAAAPLPADAVILDEDIVVIEDVQLEPRVVRAAVTITVLQNLGRFFPLDADEQQYGHQPKDEPHGRERGARD